MKTSSYATAIALAIAALTAGQAMAADNDNAVGKTREQVRAELMQYRAAHQNDVYDSETGLLVSTSIQTTPSTLTRAEVMADLAADRAAHRFDVYDSETGLLTSSTVPEAPSDLTRAQVKTELAQYRADHRYDVYDSESGLLIN
jgi:hypothetical protein